MRRGRPRLGAGAALLVALAGLALGAGCGRPRHAAPPPVEIAFWSPWPAEAMAPALAEFQRLHPGIRVVVTSLPDSLRARRVAEARGDGLPDLCAIGTEDMPALLAGGRLTDWSAAAAEFRPRLKGWESCTVGDAVYGLPWLLAPRVLYVNPRLFARAGLAGRCPPANWGEMERAAARIRRLGGGVYGYGVPTDPDGLVDGVLPLVASAGGAVLSEDRRHAVLDSVADVRAIELLVRLGRSALLAPQDSLERAFASGRLGMLLAGPGLERRLPADAPRVGALVPHPDRDSVSVSWATGEVLVSFNGSRHRHEALDLARFLVTGPAARLADSGGLATAGRRAGRPEAEVARGQEDSCRYAPAHPAWRAIKDTVAFQVEEALRGRKPADRALADAQAALEEILRR